jgi:hypothetical protein
MRRFRYGLDPLCATACALYALNRWFLKPHTHSAFLRFHFNDLLLIPAALPLVLWLQRRLGLRTHDVPPDGREIALHFAVWTVMAEVIAPRLTHVTADWRDIIAYATGALIAWFVWRIATTTAAVPQPR